MNIITPKMVNVPVKEKNVKNKNFSVNPPPAKNISFKAAPPTLITAADRKIMNVFSKHYGEIGDRIGKKVGKLVTEADSDILRKSARFTLEQGIPSIKEKNMGRAIIENVIFPFINLPLYGASWVLQRVKKIPGAEGLDDLYRKPLLRIPRKLHEIDEKTDILKGIYGKTQSVIEKFAKEKGVTKEYLLQQLEKVDDTPEAKQLVKEANEYIKENLYKVSNKFFDKHTGNFNTAYERPLNRIVTGLIPVAFLANDAYNLSVLCGDNKEESKKEAKERRSQEISRVFTTAYIQLLTFGAFTKQVNTIPWFTPVTSAATVLLSETSSRLRLGKPVFFLSKEKAKEYNKRDKEKEAKANKTEKVNDKPASSQPIKAAPEQKQVKSTYVPPLGTEPAIFTSFKAAEKTENKKPEEKKERKALISFKTFKKAVSVLIVAGFGLSFIKNSSLTKNTKLVKGIRDLAKKCKDKIYNPLAFKDFEMNSEDFKKITDSLNSVGCKEIAEGHSFIQGKYGQVTEQGIIKMFKGVLSSSKTPAISQDIITSLTTNGTKLTSKERTIITESIKKAIELEGASIAEMKYSQVAKKAAEIVVNKKVNLTKEELNAFKEFAAAAIEKSTEIKPVQVETKLKPFVDMVIQPFKFIFSAFRLPYKITSSMVKMIISPVTNKAKDAALGKAELSNFEKAIHKASVEIFGEEAVKAGKISQVIYANAMEKLQKQTLPYQKALEALQKAQITGSDVEIQKATKVLEKRKDELFRYVNTAVEKSFNGVTQSSNKNTELAMMSKMASSTVTSAFLVADNYNMVMLKSDGEDKEGAKEKANERIIQRLSSLFYSTLFINWFNATFVSTYNSSLKGMVAVAIPNTLTTEILTRKSIGMPIGRKTMKELEEIDEKNENRKGFAGQYFKFMRLLTGKKPLKDRLPKEKAQLKQIAESSVKHSTTARTPINNENKTTNLIQQLAK